MITVKKGAEQLRANYGKVGWITERKRLADHNR